MLLSQYLNEIPYCLVGSAIMFVCIYFPTQANREASQSAMYYLTFGIFFQFYYVSFGLLLLYIAPDVQSAAILVGFFYTFIVAFCGVVQPIALMPKFWTFMNKLSPYTYFIQNLLSSLLKGRTVNCSAQELAYFNPPTGQTCLQFTGAFIDKAGGYLINPDATSNCGYCKYTTTDQYMLGVGIKFAYRWRNLGFYCAYIIFDVAAMLFLYWILRYRTGSLLPSFLKRSN